MGGRPFLKTGAQSLGIVGDEPALFARLIVVRERQRANITHSFGTCSCCRVVGLVG